MTAAAWFLVYVTTVTGYVGGLSANVVPMPDRETCEKVMHALMAAEQAVGSKDKLHAYCVSKGQ